MAEETPKKKFVFKPKNVPDSPIDVAKLSENRKAMKEFLDKKIDENNIVLKEAMDRSVIFVGKTRSGKSTALEVLKNPFTFVKLSSIFSETVDAYIKHFTVEVDNGDDGNDDEKANFNISIIDTPGLFEIVDKGTSRDNDILEDIVLKCMNAEITKINAIFFVCSYSGSINPQDIKALKRFLKLFDGAQKHVYVLITKCESFKESEKQSIIDQFTRYPKMSDLLKEINSHIFFSGAVENRLYEDGFLDSFKSNLSNVISMREKLFGEIFTKDDSFDLHTLKIVDKVRLNAEKLYKDLKQQFSEKEKISNHSMFKASYRKLGSWLPLLDQDIYTEANNFLLECEKYLKELESGLEKDSDEKTEKKKKKDKKK